MDGVGAPIGRQRHLKNKSHRQQQHFLISFGKSNNSTAIVGLAANGRPYGVAGSAAGKNAKSCKLVVLSDRRESKNPLPWHP